MFVEAVRAWLNDQPEGSAGWLGALRDPSIGTALGLIHKAPEKPWTVPSLAAQVGMSRSPFAARFTALVGQAPMSYLKRWRLQLAAKLLQNQTLALSSIAERIKTAISPEMPFYWRSSIHDGIYNFAGFLIRPGNLSRARFVGYQPGLVLDRAFSPHFSSTAGYFYFFTGDFLKQTPPGKDVGYFYATLTFRL